MNQKTNEMIITPKYGIVATSEPNAAQAGLSILKKGGNAVDAAIATAIALTVTEPTSNGLGGDNFAIAWVNQQLIGMNACGRSPETLSVEALQALGHQEIPTYGVIPVTVPGQIKGWAALSKKYGKLPFRDLFDPAIRLAEDGYQIADTVQYHWEKAAQIYQEKLKGPQFQGWFNTFGEVPKKGAWVTLKDHAQTLRSLRDTDGESFYSGALADKIAAFFEEYGGFLTKNDLSRHHVEWVKPISTSYRGYDVCELPPNTQGLIGLLSFNLLERFQVNQMDLANRIHTQMEAVKLAFSDGLQYIADPKTMTVTIDDLLSKTYAKKRAIEITNEALMPHYGEPQKTGTVYLATADAEGQMVSFIQSNYMGFGSGIVIPKTGIALHNRGHNFSLDPLSPNVLAPLKKPYHTIIPGFLMKDGTPIGPFGVMGGFMQPQGHLQVISHLLDLKMSPQEALDQPRFMWEKEKTLWIEKNFPDEVYQQLKQRGHDLKKTSDVALFGRGQMIIKKANGYIVGTEKRCDGTIAYE